ncbi:Ig heavy chain Mem5 isoform X2 [Chelonia mydas]|uniref:Ig heavy chain Mem5 isoform X2 n=1 Tax=Chelonia mydas TaxID=8469 RepID=UPI0018A1B94B|nr:Ig heavy chain Mem5 isoform X2 [Chelonia mydas]XP_037743523.1 Ig heavy chain Mem5 isoform X2 [Chelonia mydas]XP_043393058.1 Ig heavy chain Mem5 isoform X2 [Chelonia mydas]XP_043393059.1 Ig heavy chain Mem5 isoform X2 [Chelonia mydas]XP_043393060.1 Ig heavy chain Mem5 isoform X2 [Chelonia mydas]XP_043393061.1 Ig heavy chain Mem5 isoform X2 [Chelonia mydas]
MRQKHPEGGALGEPLRLTQPSPSHVVDEKIPRLGCRMSGSDITTHVLSWYHQPPGQGPVFLLSHRAGGNKPVYGAGVSERFIAHLERSTNTFSLTIGNVKPADAGTYYCAVWFANRYLFGEGTRLVLGGDPGKKRPPEVALLGPARAAGPAFLCLAWGFSPESVRLRWQVDGREPGPGEASPPAGGRDGAGAAGLLSLPPRAWLDGAQVTCRVEHETRAQQSSAKLKGAGRQGCLVSPRDPVSPPDPLGNGTAGSAAPQSTGAPSLGRILVTAWWCYLGSLAASCLYGLGVSLLVGLRGLRGQQEPRRPGPPPPPPGAWQRAPRRRAGQERRFK